MSGLFEAIGTAGPGMVFSPCLKFGDEVAISGLTARLPDGGMEGGASMRGQADAIFARLRDLLLDAGGDLSNIYKLVIYVTDIGGRPEVNAARMAWLKPPYPCATLIGVTALADQAMKIEIDAFSNLGFRRHAEPA